MRPDFRNDADYVETDPSHGHGVIRQGMMTFARTVRFWSFWTWIGRETPLKIRRLVRYTAAALAFAYLGAITPAIIALVEGTFVNSFVGFFPNRVAAPRTQNPGDWVPAVMSPFRGPGKIYRFEFTARLAPFGAMIYHAIWAAAALGIARFAPHRKIRPGHVLRAGLLLVPPWLIACSFMNGVMIVNQRWRGDPGPIWLELGLMLAIVSVWWITFFVCYLRVQRPLATVLLYFAASALAFSTVLVLWWIASVESSLANNGSAFGLFYAHLWFG